MDGNVLVVAATVLNTAAVCITLYFVMRQANAQQAQVKKIEVQILEARNATWAESFLEVAKILQDEKMRDARARVFKLGEQNKKLDEWTEDERKAVEMVSQAYDVVGMLAQWNMLPKEIIVDSWADSIRRLWPICSPLIIWRRQKQKAPEFWDDFEWLKDEAQRFDESREIASAKKKAASLSLPA